ncbi:MAG: SDR family oxidoreductase [Phycisphaerae bacterium]|nr:SDR family oxidoreductase [Phycisphaerae bacterium]
MDGDVLPLANKTALVTGAARRIGRATALALAEAGADVVVHYNRSAAAAERTAAEVRDAGRKAWTIACDLSEPADAAELMSRVRDEAGAVDVLVNNASVFEADGIISTGVAEIEASIRLHAEAPLLLARGLAGQGRDGHVVNVLDTRVVDYDRAHASYHLGKRMLLTLTRMLAVELAPRVAVNAVAPGAILPPAGADEAYLATLAEANPLRRIGSVAAVTDAIRFLLGSDFITGQVVYVDGGRHMMGRMYE